VVSDGERGSDLGSELGRDLGGALRAWRDRLDPAGSGLPANTPRRAPGCGVSSGRVTHADEGAFEASMVADLRTAAAR